MAILIHLCLWERSLVHVMLQVAGMDHGEDVGHVQVVRVPGEVNLRSNNINITAPSAR